MDPLIGAALIQGGLGLANSLLGPTGPSGRDRLAERQESYAREDSAIQRRVADAEKAGIHPLAAMGFSGSGYSPVFTDPGPQRNPFDAVSEMGQNITRAAFAGANKDQHAIALQTLAVERGELENQLLRSQISRLNSAQLGPSLPAVSGSRMPGQGDSGLVVDNPLQRVAGSSMPGKEVGSLSDYSYARTAGGGLTRVPSKDVKERIEDTFFPELAWTFRNSVIPAFTSGGQRPDPKLFPLPKGQYWSWDRFTQEWRPRTKGYFTWDALTTSPLRYAD